MIRFLATFNLILVIFGITSPAEATKGSSQLSIGLGEALGPAQLRLISDDTDFFIATHVGLGIGKRFWSDQRYVGFGIGLGTGTGIYGLMGYEFLPVEFIPISLEFTAYGGSNGQVNAISMISVGFAW